MERANALPSSLRLIKLSSADGHWNGKAVNYSSNTKLAPWRWSGSLQLASWHGVCYYISSSFANSDPLPSTSCANCAARGADPITEIRDFGFYSSSSIRKQSMGRIVMGRGAALWQSLCCKPVLLLEKRKHRIKSLFHQHFYTVKELQSSPHPLLFFFFYWQVLAGRRTHPCRIPLLGWNHPTWDVLLQHGQLGRHHTRPTVWQKLWKKGCFSWFASLTTVSDAHWAFQTSYLLCYFISLLIIPLSSLLASLIPLMHSYKKAQWDCQLVEISSIWGCANSLQLRHTVIVTTFPFVWRKSHHYLSVHVSSWKQMHLCVCINVIYTLIYIRLLYRGKIPGFIPECDLFEKLMAYYMQNALVLLRVESALENEVWESCKSSCIGKDDIRSQRKPF